MAMLCLSEYLTTSYTPCDATTLCSKSHPTNQYDNPDTPTWVTDEPAHSVPDTRTSHLLYYPLPSQAGLSCCFVLVVGTAPRSTDIGELSDPRYNQEQYLIDSFARAEQSL